MTNGKPTIFYAVQVSNFTYDETGKAKWVLRNDACTNIAIGIISALLDKHNLHFIIKLPAAASTVDVETLENLFDKKYLGSIEFYREEVPISPVSSRYNFNFEFHTKIESNVKMLQKVDAMINDENTLTKNWRLVFKEIGNPIGIVSTNYFLDSPIANKVPSDVRYYERQMESFIASDIAAFQCEAGRLEAMEAYDMLYKSRDILAKQSVWGVGASYSEVSKYHTDERFEIPTIYFGNRISDSANRYTNYDTFAEAIGILSKRDVGPFKAVMLNPTRKATKEQLNTIESLSNGKVEVLKNDWTFTRKDYLQFINRAHISCNLFVTEVHGGVTHVEAMLSNNYVIMPKINNYLHKFEACNLQDKYTGFVEQLNEDRTKPDATSVADELEEALKMLRDDKSKFEQMVEMAKSVAFDYETYEGAVNRIMDDIEKCMNISEEQRRSLIKPTLSKSSV